MTLQEQEAFARGRLQGLREMDEAYQGPSDYGERMKLRQEYQQPN